MRAHRRLHAMQARATTTHTLTLSWYSPDGVSAAGSDGMESIVPKFEGRTQGKVQASSSIPGSSPVTRTMTIGTTEVPVLTGGLHIPVTALLDGAGQLRLRVGWECVVETVGVYDDPALSGARFRVVNVPTKSFMTARRLDIVDVTHLAVP